MPPISKCEDEIDGTVFHKVFSGLSFGNMSFSKVSRVKDGRSKYEERKESEEETMDESGSSDTDKLDASFIDVFYDFQKRDDLDEETIPIGLLTEEESVMVESIETSLRDYSKDDSKPDEITVDQFAADTCSTVTASDAKEDDEIPIRFLRAGKGCPVEGRRRYENTLKWRRDNKIDTILSEPNPHFELIKSNYPHYFHLKGYSGQPVFYDKPSKMNLKALRKAGVTLKSFLRYHTMVTEFQWQYVERDDLESSIYIIDLSGIRVMDFMGEAVDFVRKASELSSIHYPERAGTVFVVNVPSWFKIIWNVVKPIVDDATLQKVSILQGNQIFRELSQKVPVYNIPPEYGGTSVPLGESPEELLLFQLMRHNNRIKDNPCTEGYQCPFCNFVLARPY